MVYGELRLTASGTGTVKSQPPPLHAYAFACPGSSHFAGAPYSKLALAAAVSQAGHLRRPVRGGPAGGSCRLWSGLSSCG